MSVLTEFPPAEVFIETGSGMGDTIERARHHYRIVHSIELDQATVDHCARRFRGVRNVKLHRGSSPVVLRQIIKPERRTVFWLDAHYSGGSYIAKDRYKHVQQCPLLAELAVITAAPWVTRPVVLIDDLFMFKPWPAADEPDPRRLGRFDRAQWPLLEDIAAALKGYVLEEAGDVLKAWPR